MKNDIIKKSKQIAIPNNIQRKKSTRLQTKFLVL